MYSIGIDVGATFTKYCVMKEREIESLFAEKTPVRQKEYFDNKVDVLLKEYPDAEIISCGYGKENVAKLSSINELTALAKGCYFVTGNDGIILDVGGQDTKIISQEKGKLKEFFINDKCAAGSGMFLLNSLEMVGVRFADIDLVTHFDISMNLSSTCAVFAQSEIVQMIVDNRTEQEILRAVISQILIKSKPLLAKVKEIPIVFSGGLSQIEGIAELASEVLGRECRVVQNGMYLAAIGCALL